jgi:NADH dehydrogenase FAD-containing subunit
MASVRAARRLQGFAEVLLVSDRDALVERIRLHEAAARDRDPRRPLKALLAGTGVTLVHAGCDEIDRAWTADLPRDRRDQWSARHPPAW